MIKVLFEDSDLLVLQKPAGLVVTRSETQKADTLEDLLKCDFNLNIDRAGIVHRLDKDTSGVILVAKTEEVKSNLQLQFKERVVKKEYLALVHGSVEKEGKIEAPIGRNPGNREKFTVFDEDGDDVENIKPAITEYKLLGNYQLSIINYKEIFYDLNKIQFKKLERMNYNHFSLLSCFPLTGRTHQIRVHLKYKGFPIVSDEKYGGRKVVRLDHRWCGRQFLHAKKIGFKHPENGQWMEFDSDLPEDLTKALENLEKIN